MLDRTAVLDRLAAERFDVLVIGGGITGAGVARDAALRGLRVALVERDDWACGTSSRSSRLVHGGVRYLEHGHLHLVFESSRERRTLLRIAPHLVRPLEFVWPVYAGARVPRWKLAAGLMLYDLLALFRNVAPHRRLSAAEIAEREPGVRRDGLTGGASYYDASTDDTRLTLANALAASDAGAAILNHAPARALVRDEGSPLVTGAVVEDALTGRAVRVHARVVVNAAGPWSDEVRRLDDPSAAPGVRGSKGVHVAVPRERMGNRGALTLLSPLDGRVMFVLPAGTHAIVGTTETATTATPDDVRASAADVDYLLRSANAFFPEARLTSADVVSAWAGIRPLIASGYRHGATGATAAAASSASREHLIERGSSGVVTVSGGKLTTYRSMAAEVVDEVERALGRERRRGVDPTETRHLPGGQFTSYDAELAAADEALRASGALDPAQAARVAERLVRAHGSAWRAVWALATRDPALAAPLVPGLPYLRAELVWGVERETARTLTDLLVRRTHVAFETPDNGRIAARSAVGIVAPLLGWDAAATEGALGEYERDVTRMFSIEV